LEVNKPKGGARAGRKTPESLPEESGPKGRNNASTTLKKGTLAKVKREKEERKKERKKEEENARSQGGNTDLVEGNETPRAKWSPKQVVVVVAAAAAAAAAVGNVKKKWEVQW